MDIREKSYVGREEAFEYAIARGIYELPRKNKQIVTVEAIASGRQCTVIGKDENGYYIGYPVLIEAI